MIDRHLAAFLEEGLVIHIGTCSADLEPNGTRVTAVTVDADGRHVVAYVPRVAIRQIQSDLEGAGLAALVFVRPADDRACQVKGVVTGIRAATARERRLVAAQWEASRQVLEDVGLPPILTESWRVWPSMAVRLRVTALFDQTPGPNAGAPLP